MRILFIHQNFPGQYKHLAARYGADPNNQVVALGEQKNLEQRPIPPGVKRYGYTPQRGVTPNQHPYLRNIETGVLRGQAVARSALELRKRGFVPDLICAHPGWGEALYLADVYPDSRLLTYYEFYYRGHGADVGFDPEFPATLDSRLRVRTWNMVQQSTFFSSTWGLSPTRWQASVYPGEFQRRISVIHDGIDTAALQPDPRATFTLSNGKVLTRDDEVITFVSRGLEPYRGIHTFIRALPDLMRLRPHAHFVLVGGDKPSYGSNPNDAPDWRTKLLKEVAENVAMDRLHFVGKIPYAHFVSLLRISRAHVYLTYPFVLSWSLLEAMALGAPIVASSTSPVREVIRHEDNGLLFDFFDRDALVQSVRRVLEDADLRQTLTRAARTDVVRQYDLESICLPAQMRLVDDLLNGRQPVSTDNNTGIPLLKSHKHQLN
jgi:glycosyltransferase involved in cell wall biosynthesis